MDSAPSHGLQGRTLTELDHVRLEALLRRQPAAAHAPSVLQECLETADLVPSREIGPDVVTMHSQVLLADPVDGRRHRYTLCYPPDADPEQGRVSVASPLGASLLGLRVGDTARWQTPAGSERTLEIVALLFQPEASGDYTA